MKKIYCKTTLILMILFSNHFVILAQFDYQLGYINQTSYPRPANLNSEIISYNGINVGINFSLKFTHLLYLQTGLLSNIGFCNTAISVPLYPSISDSRYVLFVFKRFQFAIPFHIGFYIPSNNNFSFYPFLGPTATYDLGVDGRYLDPENNMKTLVSRFDYSTPSLNNIDYSLGLGVKIKYKKNHIQGLYNWGIKKMNSNYWVDCFSISLGREF